MNKKKIFTGAPILFISFIFIQSLFFKFTDAPETQHIFGVLDQWAMDIFGFEGLFLPPGPFNAYVIGTAELIASIILLTGLFTSRKVFIPLGSLLSMGIMTGAIFFHLFTPLGIVVQDDGGTLFFMAVIIWFSSLFLIVAYRDLLKNFLCNLFCKKTNN